MKEITITLSVKENKDIQRALLSIAETIEKSALQGCDGISGESKDVLLFQCSFRDVRELEKIVYHNEVQ